MKSAYKAACAFARKNGGKVVATATGFVVLIGNASAAALFDFSGAVTTATSEVAADFTTMLPLIGTLGALSIAFAVWRKGRKV